MKKLIITIMCVLALGYSATAQTMAFGSLGNDNSSGWDIVVSCGIGPVDMLKEMDSPITTASVSAHYKLGYNLYCGTTIGLSVSDSKDIYLEPRMLLDLGSAIPVGNNAFIIQISPGIAMEDFVDVEDSEPRFSYDARLGYRFNVNSNFALQFTAGVGGTYAEWLSFPLTLSVVF